MYGVCYVLLHAVCCLLLRDVVYVVFVGALFVGCFMWLDVVPVLFAVVCCALIVVC